MGDQPDPIPVPDAHSTADVQQSYNIGAQRANMINQDNPYGSLSFQQTGVGPNGVPIYTSKSTLDPAQQPLLQALYGSKNAAATQGQNIWQNAGYGANPSQVVGDATTGLTKDAMSKQLDYLNPYFTKNIDNLDTKLKNQGFNPGTPGYDAAMRSLTQNQDRSVEDFLSKIQPQMFSQAVQSYMLPAQMGKELSTFGAPINPSWMDTAKYNMQPANFLGAQQLETNAATTNYNQQMAQNNAMMNGLFGIPTAILGGWAKGGFPGLGGGGDMAATALDLMPLGL